MADYTELVKFLRWLSPWAFPDASKKRMNDAAAAIEDLQAVLKEADKKQAYQHDCICELTAENEELKAEAKQLEPKRGEWKETDMGWDGDIAWVCSVCGEPWTLIYGTPKENNMNYCPNCGAKMTDVQE